MGLRVWLPLNGNLIQQGCSNVVATANGATVNTAGKIGSCYSFDGSNDLISLTGNDLYDIISGGTQPMSFAFWVYHADSTRAVIFGDFQLSGAISFNIELTTAHRVRFYWSGTPDKNFSTESAVSASGWTHIAITYDGNVLKIYKDGILSSDTYNGTLPVKTKTSGAYYLGRDNRTGTTVLNGRLNDFRIYDHCLSAAEVREISQGLVLHYKLDDITNGVQNSSGYNHPTTILGEPTLISRSPRYSKGLQFNGTTDAINCGLDWQIQGAQEITVSCWVYDENWSNSTGKYYFSSQQTGGFLISQKADNKFRFRMDTYTDSALSARAYKDIDVTAIVEAGWHHFVGVYTTSALKIYIDGELKGTNNVTTYGAHFGTATSLFLGAECAGKVTAEPFCACSLSDFRFYYTALSEDDIKQLYQLGAKIDNQQNLHTFELNEIPISVIGTGLSTSYSESHPITTIHTYRTATNTQNQYTQQSITCTGNIYTSTQIPVNLGRTYYFRFSNQNSITSMQYSYTPYTWVRSGSGYVKRAQATVFGRYAKFVFSVLFYDSDSRLLGTKILNSGTINDQGSSSYSPITMSMGIMSDNSEFTIPYVLINNSEETAYIVIKEEYYASSASVNNRILVAEYSPTVGIKIQKPGIVRTNYIKEITDTKFRKDKIIETNNLIEI